MPTKKRTTRKTKTVEKVEGKDLGAPTKKTENTDPLTINNTQPRKVGIPRKETLVSASPTEVDGDTFKGIEEKNSQVEILEEKSQYENYENSGSVVYESKVLNNCGNDYILGERLSIFPDEVIEEIKEEEIEISLEETVNEEISLEETVNEDFSSIEESVSDVEIDEEEIERNEILKSLDDVNSKEEESEEDDKYTSFAEYIIYKDKKIKYPLRTELRYGHYEYSNENESYLEKFERIQRNAFLPCLKIKETIQVLKGEIGEEIECEFDISRSDLYTEYHILRNLNDYYNNFHPLLPLEQDESIEISESKECGDNLSYTVRNVVSTNDGKSYKIIKPNVKRYRIPDPANKNRKGDFERLKEYKHNNEITPKTRYSALVWYLSDRKIPCDSIIEIVEKLKLRPELSDYTIKEFANRINQENDLDVKSLLEEVDTLENVEKPVKEKDENSYFNKLEEYKNLNDITPKSRFSGVFTNLRNKQVPYEKIVEVIEKLKKRDDLNDDVIGEFSKEIYRSTTIDIEFILERIDQLKNGNSANKKKTSNSKNDIKFAVDIMFDIFCEKLGINLDNQIFEKNELKDKMLYFFKFCHNDNGKATYPQLKHKTVADIYARFLNGIVISCSIKDDELFFYSWNEEKKLFGKNESKQVFDKFLIFIRELVEETSVRLYRELEIGISNIALKIHTSKDINKNFFEKKSCGEDVGCKNSIEMDEGFIRKKDEISQIIENKDTMAITQLLKNDKSLKDDILKIINIKDIVNGLNIKYDIEFRNVTEGVRSHVDLIKTATKNPFLKDNSFLNKINQIPYMFPIKGGKVIEFKTREKVNGKGEITHECYSVVRDRTYNDFFTMECDIEYSETAENETLNKFIDEIFLNDPYQKEAIFVAFGLCLLGLPCKEFFIFEGIAGNGKGTLMSILKKVMGSFSTTLSSGKVFGKSEDLGSDKASNEVFRLSGARCTTVSESPNGDKLNTNFVNKMSGGCDADALSARQLNDNDIVFINCAILFILCNEAIEITDESLLRRVRKFVFNTLFRDKSCFLKDTENLSNIQKNDLLRKNPGMYIESEDIRVGDIDFSKKIDEGFKMAFFKKMVDGALKYMNGYTWPIQITNSNREEAQEESNMANWCKKNLRYTDMTFIHTEKKNGKEVEIWPSNHVMFLTVEQLFEDYKNWIEGKVNDGVIDSEYDEKININKFSKDFSKLVRSGKLPGVKPNRVGKTKKSAYIHLRFSTSLESENGETNSVLEKLRGLYNEKENQYMFSTKFYGVEGGITVDGMWMAIMKQEEETKKQKQEEERKKQEKQPMIEEKEEESEEEESDNIVIIEEI